MNQAGLPSTFITVRTPFGRDRQVEMLERRGVGVMCQTVDDGPRQIILITRRHVHKDSLKSFDDFSRSDSKG